MEIPHGCMAQERVCTFCASCLDEQSLCFHLTNQTKSGHLHGSQYLPPMPPSTFSRLPKTHSSARLRPPSSPGQPKPDRRVTARGADKGGIIVRQSESLKSPELGRAREPREQQVRSKGGSGKARPATVFE